MNMPTPELSKTSRPKLSLERTPTEIAFEILSVMGLVWLLFIVGSAWFSMPDQIPTHFGFTVKADAWGRKIMLWLLPCIGLVVYAGLTILARYPHTYNYPFPVTETNAEAQYRLGRTMIGAIKMEVLWLFSVIEYEIVRTAMGKSEGLGLTFLPVTLFAIFGTTIVYFVQAWKAK